MSPLSLSSEICLFVFVFERVRKGNEKLWSWGNDNNRNHHPRSKKNATDNHRCGSNAVTRELLFDDYYSFASVSFFFFFFFCASALL